MNTLFFMLNFQNWVNPNTISWIYENCFCMCGCDSKSTLVTICIYEFDTILHVQAQDRISGYHHRRLVDVRLVSVHFVPSWQSTFCWKWQCICLFFKSSLNFIVCQKLRHNICNFRVCVLWEKVLFPLWSSMWVKGWI